MATTLNALVSFEERFIRDLLLNLEPIIGAVHSREEDLSARSLALPMQFNEPQFNLLLQVLPDQPRLPVRQIRVTFNIAINRDGGDSPFEQGLKLGRVVDQICQYIQTRVARDLNCRNVRITNKTISTRSEAYTGLLQFDMYAFLIKGEY